MNPETRLVHPPRVEGEPTGAISTPIYQTSTFDVTAQSPGTPEYDYSRSGNPTRRVLESQLAALDDACAAFAFNSGMAAIDAVLRLLESGDEVIAGDDLYGGANRILAHAARAAGLHVRHVDTTDPAAVAHAVTPRTRLVLLESPTNPRLRVIDIRAIAEIAHARGALVAVDNSLLSAYLQKPLALGADIAIQSATKALGGHSDLTAGVVAVRDLALAERLAFIQNAYGTALAPFDAWLLLRGLETLALRVRRQVENTRALLLFLQRHPAVTRLYYPARSACFSRQPHARSPWEGGRGEEFSPPPLCHNESADREIDLYPCTLISFETGDLNFSRRLIRSTRLFRATVSWGGVTSSISLPCEMSHASIPAEVRAQRRLREDIVRISVGIEAPEDLVADLSRALDAAARSDACLITDAVASEPCSRAGTFTNPCAIGTGATSSPMPP